MSNNINSNDPVTDGKSASISVFFPCFNEAESIVPLVEKTVTVVKEISDDFEIIIVDDGSSDGTAEIADRLAGETEQVKVVHHEVNSGYGSALQSGFRAATKELVFYTDGDGQFDVSELPPLLKLIDGFDIVSCYRLNRKEGLVRKLNAWCWGRLVNFVFRMKLRDIDCAFKLYRRTIFDDIKMQSTGALIDTEILARATGKGYTVTQTGVHHYPRAAGTPTGAKLSVILRAFKELFKLRRDIAGR